MGRMIKSKEELLERVKKMLPSGIPEEAISDVEIDNIDGWNGYWVYISDGYISIDMGCHTIHEYNLKDLKEKVENIFVYPDDPNLEERGNDK